MCERLVDTGDMTLTNFSEFAIAELGMPSNETTSTGKSNTCKAATQTRKSSQTSAVDSTSKDEGCYPYWTDYTAEKRLTLVVAYRDRLARFGAELIERLIEQNGGQLVVLN